MTIFALAAAIGLSRRNERLFRHEHLAWQRNRTSDCSSRMIALGLYGDHMLKSSAFGAREKEHEGLIDRFIFFGQLPE